MAANKSKSRPSVSKILEGQNWERKEYRHLSPNDITELVGSYIGVPKMVYRMAMELDRKLIQGSIMEIKLPLNRLYMFVGLGKGLLRFEIVDQEPSGTLVRADAEVIGIALLTKDWGYGRRNMNAVLDRTSEHLRRMRGE